MAVVVLVLHTNLGNTNVRRMDDVHLRIRESIRVCVCVCVFDANKLASWQASKLASSYVNTFVHSHVRNLQNSGQPDKNIMLKYVLDVDVVTYKMCYEFKT